MIGIDDEWMDDLPGETGTQACMRRLFALMDAAVFDAISSDLLGAPDRLRKLGFPKVARWIDYRLNGEPA